MADALRLKFINLLLLRLLLSLQLQPTTLARSRMFRGTVGRRRRQQVGDLTAVVARAAPLVSRTGPIGPPVVCVGIARAGFPRWGFPPGPPRNVDHPQSYLTPVKIKMWMVGRRQEIAKPFRSPEQSTAHPPHPACLFSHSEEWPSFYSANPEIRLALSSTPETPAAPAVR